MRRLSFSACIVWVVARVVPCLIGLDQEEEFGYVLSLQAHTLSGSLLIAHTHTHTQTALCPVQEAETMPLEMWPPPDPVHTFPSTLNHGKQSGEIRSVCSNISWNMAPLISKRPRRRWERRRWELKIEALFWEVYRGGGGPQGAFLSFKRIKKKGNQAVFERTVWTWPWVAGRMRARCASPWGKDADPPLQRCSVSHLLQTRTCSPAFISVSPSNSYISLIYSFY